MRTAREALFDAIVSGGWANKSGGDVESPVGHFAIVTNSTAELFELRQAFEDVIDAYGDVSDADLTGSFIVHTNSDGFLSIERLSNEREAEWAFATDERRFDRWSEGDES